MKLITKEQTFKEGFARIRLIIFGPGGVGKTTLAYSFNDDPRTAPVLGIDFAGNPERIVAGLNAPIILRLEKPDDLDLVVDFFRAGQPLKHELRKVADIASDLVFKTVVFDTFSEWQRGVIDRITGNEHIKQISNAISPEAIAHGGKIFSVSMKAARDFLLALDVNVILVMQEQEKTPLTGEPIQLQPFLYGQARKQISTHATLQGRLERISGEKGGTDVQVWWDEPSFKSHVKNQTGAPLGRRMVNPTATKIIDILTKVSN